MAKIYGLAHPGKIYIIYVHISIKIILNFVQFTWRMAMCGITS